VSDIRWFAATFPAARKIHAATRQAYPFSLEFATDEARAAWYAVTDANDPQYTGAFSIRVSCRRSGLAIPRIWRDRFTPAGLYDLGGRVAELLTCRDCAALFTALHMAPVPGLDRECDDCGGILPANFFITDLRCHDGLSRTCTPCRYGRPRPAYLNRPA
jgi:hypothetical protein